MYFRYLLVVVLVACAYANDISDDNVKRQSGRPCQCPDGRPGTESFSSSSCPKPSIVCDRSPVIDHKNKFVW